MNANEPIKKSSAPVRLRSLDILRGAVMVLMAIDHVRVYSGLPAGGQSPGIFFTRWITHFCAPAFVFFAGTSAFLYGIKLNDKRKLAVWLLTRGFMLVVLELTLIRFCWTFNFNYSEFVLAGVIWMLGCCMMLMAALIWLRPAVIGITGLAIIFLQQVFSLLPTALPQALHEPFGRFWEFIYPSGLEGPPGITILYVLVPWIGVMAAGYGFGQYLLQAAGTVRKNCLWIGVTAILVFVVTGSIITLLKHPAPGAPPFIFRLLNQTKYPASPLYLLMTLGPVIALIPFAGKATGWLAAALAKIGSVPMFYYLLHILLIHVSAIIVNNYISPGNVQAAWYAHAPYSEVPPEFKWSLPLLYLVFAVDVIILYFACSWYAQYKFANPKKKWLKYL